MCTSSTGPLAQMLGKKKGGAGGGVSTGGSSYTGGPSAAAAMASTYVRQKNTAPILDDILGTS